MVILSNFFYWLLNKLLCNDLWDTNLKFKDFRASKARREVSAKFWKELKIKLISKAGLESRAAGYEEITEQQYQYELGNSSTTKVKSETVDETFKAVMDYRKFEIELYWKRATYFWAFIASTFIAYAGLFTSGNSKTLPMLIVICIGLVLSNAWYYSNKGSKTWQRHWEKHLDLLEDPITGPLYKTIFSTRTYSVSKINDIVSNAFRAAWLGLGCYFFYETNRFHLNFDIKNIDFPILLIVGATVLIWTSMKFGKGRGRFRARAVRIYRRL